VPHRDRAQLRVRREIVREPLVLRGACREGDVVVDDDDVPVAEVEAAVALGPRARATAVVIERAVSARAVVLVVPHHRDRAVYEAAPVGRVAVPIVREAAVRERVVAERDRGAGDAVDERRRRVVVGVAAVGDVGGADQDHLGGRGIRRGARETARRPLLAARSHDRCDEGEGDRPQDAP